MFQYKNFKNYLKNDKTDLKTLKQGDDWKKSHQ